MLVHICIVFIVCGIITQSISISSFWHLGSHTATVFPNAGVPPKRGCRNRRAGIVHALAIVVAAPRPTLAYLCFCQVRGPTGGRQSGVVKKGGGGSLLLSIVALNLALHCLFFSFLMPFPWYRHTLASARMESNDTTITAGAAIRNETVALSFFRLPISPPS